MEKLLTVSIGVYNGANYIMECVNSILPYIDQGVEIIITDDGSTDDTLEKVLYYSKKFPNDIRVFSQPNKGQGSTYNIGIDRASGKYIMFMDADDLFAPKAHRFLAKLTHCKSDIVGHDMRYFYEEGYVDRLVCQPLAEGGDYDYDENFLRLIKLVHSNVFRTDFLRENQIYADDFYKQGADVMLTFKASLYAKNQDIIHEEAYYYRVSDRNFTNLNNLKKLAPERIIMIKSVVDNFHSFIETKTVSEKKKEIAVKSANSYLGLAYMGALIAENPRQKMEYVNSIIKSEPDLWNNMSIRLKILRTNSLVTSLIGRIYLIMRDVRFKKGRA